MFEIKREAKIYKDSIVSLRMIKKQACESYENAFTCLFFTL